MSKTFLPYEVKDCLTSEEVERPFVDWNVESAGEGIVSHG